MCEAFIESIGEKKTNKQTKKNKVLDYVNFP